MRSLAELANADINEIGGKAHSLGKLISLGVNVPPGFVIETDAFELVTRDIQNEINHILSITSPSQIEQIRAEAVYIQKVIQGCAIPKQLITEIFDSYNSLGSVAVAVRSSATVEDSSSAAWAGQFSSYMNVQSDDLLEAVKKCWSSLYSAEALMYRSQHDILNTSLKMAVVVQVMILGEKSGVGFSINPVNNNYDEMVIEAAFGLGEAIVSGVITPDNYVVAKGANSIIDEKIATKTKGLFSTDTGNEWRDLSDQEATSRVLTDMEISEVAKVMRSIEVSTNEPCDVEWVFADDILYVTQSRPITTFNQTIKHSQTEIRAINLDEYQKFTQIDDATSYFFAFGFLFHIADLGGLVTYSNGVFKSYILKGALEATKTKAKSIYLDAVAYQQLKSDVFQSYESVQDTFQTLKMECTKANLLPYLDAVDELSAQYRFTEFFYTDGIYEAKAEDLNFIRDFEKFKLGGRKMVNQIGYTDDALMKQLLQWVSEIFSIPLSDLQWYKMPEVVNLFDNPTQRITPELLAERRKGYVMYFDELVLLHEHAGEKVEHIIYESDTDDLVGLTAFPGVVQAIARVAHVSASNFEEMSQLVQEIRAGEVLVVDSTVPEIIAACGKAAAIITNQGGMLSHAAIVARELQIPCVVGVEGATSKIKTGDKIEVNANTGVIRKL